MPWEEIIEAICDFVSDSAADDSSVEIVSEGESIASKLKKLAKGVKILTPGQIKEKVIDFLRFHERNEVSDLVKKVLDKDLKKSGISPGMRKTAREIIDNVYNKEWKFKNEERHPYSWRYLMATLNSDRAIWRTRIRQKWGFKCNIQIQFRSPLKPKLYTYHCVPKAVFTIMCISPLRYLTKNNYFAGAYNFFWYSWWYKQPENSTIGSLDLAKYITGFRFWNKKKGSI